MNAADKFTITVEDFDFDLTPDVSLGEKWHQGLPEVPVPVTQEFFGRPPVELVDAGSSVVDVPLLMCQCPDVPGATVTTMVTSALNAGGRATFKILGVGVAGGVNVNVETSAGLTCGPNTSAVLFARIPVLWETYRMEGREQLTVRSHPMKLKSGDQPGRVIRATTTSIVVARHSELEHAVAGVAYQLGETSELDRSFGMAVGFPIPHCAATGEVNVTASIGHKVTAIGSLPGEHRYIIDWLAVPAGARVVLADT